MKDGASTTAQRRRSGADRDRARARASALTIAAASALTGLGCDLSNPGVPVPERDINFPIALALTPPSAPRFLLVANSNFDLRYSAGTLQSFDVAEIRSRIEHLIAGDYVREGDPATLDANDSCAPPDEPCFIDSDEFVARAGFPWERDLVVEEVLVGSQMDGIALGRDGARAYLPVRSGSGGLTWIDISPDSGLLECGPAGQMRESCDALHRGANPDDAARRGLSLPSDPVAIVVQPMSSVGVPGAPGDPFPDEFIVMAHRGGSASLFVHDGDPATQPRFVHVLPGIPRDVINADFQTDTGLTWFTSAAPLSLATRSLVGVTVVQGEAGFELAIADTLPLNGIDDGLDTRDVIFDAGGRFAWVLSGRPEAVLTLDLDHVPDVPGDAPVVDIDPVGFGPMRLELAQVGARQYLVATCFTGRNLYVLEPGGDAVATVPGFAGPFEMTYDPVSRWLFVADYRDSVVRIVDLSPLEIGDAPHLLATLGTPRPVTVFR
jgi:hypothetical protein